MQTIEPSHENLFGVKGARSLKGLPLVRPTSVKEGRVHSAASVRRRAGVGRVVLPLRAESGSRAVRGWLSPTVLPPCVFSQRM